MSIVRLVSAAALVTLVTACGQTTWVKPEATVQDFNVDKYGCQKDAIAHGGVVYMYGVASRMPDWDVYNNCMVARGWRATKG
jgi:hypothetical protein